MITKLMMKLGYTKGEKLQYLSKRICGIWLVWVSLVILIGTLFGGEQKINMAIFDVGYFIGFAAILLNKRLYKRFGFGSPSAFQNKMTLLSIIFMFVLLVLIGGPNFQDHNYRMIWLGAFLAIGLHFIPFSLVHGRLMILLAILSSANALVGIFNPAIEFQNIALIDVAIKLVFGFLFIFSKRPEMVVRESRIV